MPKLCDFTLMYLGDTLHFGIVSNKKIKKNALIASTHGEIVADLRKHTLQVNAEQHQYDPYFSGYISHSCEPNLRFDIATRNLIAQQNIGVYDVLTMDYRATEDVLWQQFICHCNSKLCRGQIYGKLESPIKLDHTVTDIQSNGGRADG